MRRTERPGGVGVRMLQMLLALALGGACGAAGASLEEANALYAAKDYAGAHAEFERLAEIGSHGAQFNLGVMYLHGEDVARDLVAAYAWMALACQDHVPEWEKARDMVYEHLDAARKPAADAARTELFERLSDESIAKQLEPALPTRDSDLNRARITYRTSPDYPFDMQRAGKKGYVEILFAVDADGTTRLHSVVSATTVSFANAAIDAIKHWRFQPARIAGKPVMEYGLMQQFHFNLVDLQADESKARHTLDALRKKAQAGNAQDAYRYGSALEVLSTFAHLSASEANPNPWFWMAASKGSGPAQFSLGNNLLYGKACTADATKGIQWLRRAAEAGQPEAQFVLALDMLSGARLSADRPAAMRWLRRASERGFSAARLKLAWLESTRTESGVRDPVDARRLIDAVPAEFIDQLSLAEVRAAVDAANGDFLRAIEHQNQAIKEAEEYELPTQRLREELSAYRSGRSWADETTVAAR